MTKSRIALIPVAGIAIAWLLYVAVSSFVSIQSVPDMAADARGHALWWHFAVPLVGSVVVTAVSGVAWFIFGSESFRGVTTPDGTIKTPPAPPNREGRFTSDIEILKAIAEKRREIESAASATVITLREPNIDLSITLTGDAASDAVGRKKIGAVMEHYGSGASGKNAVDPIDGNNPADGTATTRNVAKAIEIIEAIKANGGAA